MSLGFFLNDLSDAPVEAEIHDARKRMRRFVETIRRTKELLSGTAVTLRSAKSMHDLELGADYPIAKWMNDTAVEKEERLFFRSVETSATLFPLPHEVDAITNNEERHDCYYEGRSALAFSAARLLDGLTISFHSDSCWDRPFIPLTVHRLDDDANIIENTVDAHHASGAGHIDTHTQWLQDLVRVIVRDGDELWDKRKDLFPSLEFCKEVRIQLRSFKKGDPAFLQILKRLKQIQAAFAQWDGTPIGKHTLNTRCNPESDPTLKKFAEEHTFTRPDGQRMVFRWHAYFTPEPGRIFFEGDSITRKGIIGCIARNGLPTVQSPT